MDQETIKEVGKELQKLRREAKLKLPDISKDLKIRRVYLEAIESGDVKAIPSDVYLFGYIKKYCELLDIDPDPYIVRIKSPVEKETKMPGEKVVSEELFLPSKELAFACLGGVIILYVIIFAIA